MAVSVSPFYESGGQERCTSRDFLKLKMSSMQIWKTSKKYQRFSGESGFKFRGVPSPPRSVKLSRIANDLV